MAVLARDMRKKFWFGTENRMQFITTPLQGADVSSQNWSEGGVGLNGGGFQLGSFGSHKSYIFEWPASSTLEEASLMSAYASGTYGRGLIYFVDPLIYERNILPEMWADPSIGIGYEGSSLVYGVTPTETPTSNWQVNNLPIRSAVYDLVGVTPGYRGAADSLFIPIPEGYGLALGAIHSRTGSGRVMYLTQSTSGTVSSSAVQLPILSASSTNVVTTAVSGGDIAGVRLFVGKTNPLPGTVTLSALTARLFPLDKGISSVQRGPWVPGEGHSGCRFEGRPTNIRNTGVDGGQVSYAATFREVGSWVNG